MNVIDQVMNYSTMYVSTDLIFYKVIFRMREIKIMEFTPSIKSYNQFKSIMYAQRMWQKGLYVLLGAFNIYIIYYFYMVVEEEDWT